MCLSSELFCLQESFFLDPFLDANQGDDKGLQDGLIHIRIQQRNGRKTLTTVQGIADSYDKKKIVKACKKVLNYRDYVAADLIFLEHFPGIRLQWHCCRAPGIRRSDPASRRPAKQHCSVLDEGGYCQTGSTEGSRFLNHTIGCCRRHSYNFVYHHQGIATITTSTFFPFPLHQFLNPFFNS